MQDEELPPPPGRSASRSRLLWAAAVLVAVVIVAAAVARIATHSSSPSAAPTPTVTVAPSSGPAPSHQKTPTRTRPSAASKPPAVLHVLHRVSSAAIDTAHGECPRLASTCTTTGETPAEVTAGLRASFARAGHLVAVSDIAYNPGSGPRLAYRRLSARAGRLTISVEVRPLAEGDGTGSQASTEGSGHVVRYQTVAGGLSVEVQGSAPTSRYIDLGRLERLAADPRLLALG